MRILDEHGTQLMELKPSSILAAAEEDLRRRARNKIAYQDRENEVTTVGYEQYAFLCCHVHRAKNVQQLLRLAIFDARSEEKAGQRSSKRMTRLIYRWERLLQEAQDLALRQPIP